MVVYTFNLSTWGDRQVGFCEFMASLVYIVPGLYSETLSQKQQNRKWLARYSANPFALSGNLELVPSTHVRKLTTVFQLPGIWCPLLASATPQVAEETFKALPFKNLF